MESTKGKMDMHFETIANDQTRNADLRIPTVNTRTASPLKKPNLQENLEYMQNTASLTRRQRK
jgi:hypothetical protein